MPRSTRILACAAVTAAGAFLFAALPATASQDKTPSPTVSASGQRVSVPAYFYPGGAGAAYWDRLAGSGAAVGMAVANPASGPGADTTANQDYVTQLRKADAAGVDVIGYVPTGYLGTTGLPTRSGSTAATAWKEQVKADVDKWAGLYGDAGLDGIFLDEGLARCGPDNQYAQDYLELKTYIETELGVAAKVVANPGTGTEECYKETADTLVTFEGDENAYRGHRPQQWEANVPSDKIWHLVYGVPDTARASEVVSLSRKRNAGHVYVTDDGLDNPWDTLPPAGYWDSLTGRG
ncbi:spherulation-specific family 4 protein (plasmid) [Streptomyces sp. HUAS 31]|uniref:spherulation-specific family 4 protein n=1 Tax=Streptomyces TaxID=1883 RepID=UPI0023062A4C|nr:spherulation-specific family 4 protein [Streptomyces sp. HUAS 31]WCE02434.1 spherulation-specific family 4 protein [Streptomyces sp. HUAS 31]